MTDVELLPLYAELQGHPKIEIIKHYARANVAHATAAKDAEIEALRRELDRLRGEHVRVRRDRNAAQARAERLAEALRDIESRPWNGVRPIQIASRAALRDHDGGAE